MVRIYQTTGSVRRMGMLIMSFGYGRKDYKPVHPPGSKCDDFGGAVQNLGRNIEDISELRRRLTFDPITGRLFSKRARRTVGALVSSKTGYLCVWIKNRRFLCHRVAWALHYGFWVMPPAEIDHVNGNRADNRIANLRIFSRQMQMRNVRLSRANTTGTTGVHWCTQTQCYSATINVNRRQIWLGRHNTLEAAVAARRAAEQQYGWPT